MPAIKEQPIIRDRLINVYKHSIVELQGVAKNITGYVVGNGMSKEFYDIDRLATTGLIFGCNCNFKAHHVDVLGWRDHFNTKHCYLFDGIKVLGINEFKQKDEYFIQRAANSIYWYNWGFSVGGIGVNSMESTGNFMFATAVFMGCNPIILVGCDCCALKQPKGNWRSNVYKENVRKLQKPAGKYKTSDTLIKFKNSFHNAFQRLEKSRPDLKIYKLGDYGILELPTIELPQFERSKHGCK